ncbi:SusC/RagA family TonB-linked outer membrane protein [Chitinophaga sp. S165]|uniref:SusC/RagA family TonB-linked outer membrane protein n=1 Tax=Chitinophaga sp. S165 TaxID=2135462 RepID=UPI000D70C12D|nr:SusC/RagA family TonB-linked outer membrane protein [Chitinophaga sp. S165]PWV49115.1 TonB-linked SusC/RagA family outer membrane protein [Chitinophaga sp. S165]
MVHSNIKRYISLLTCLVILACMKVQAQQQVVSGRLLDPYGQPLAKATVFIKGRGDSTTTDATGNFSIQAGANNTLVIKYPGYHTIEQKVQGTTMLLRMEDSFIPSPKSVPVLYGDASRNSIVGSVATVYTNQLSTTPATLYAYALPGRIAGLYSQQNSGFRSPGTGNNFDVDIFVGNIPRPGALEPNDNTEIGLWLRGQVPVTIVDGIQRDVFSIDPENIESISVLKDGLSTILLGQRSSRGVLLVTTKRARAGKPRVSFTAQTAIQQSLRMPKPLPAWQYAYLLNEALQNDGKQPLYKESDIVAFRDHTSPYTHPDVNWYDEILRSNAPMSRYNLNVNGGGDVARYSVSLNYTGQQGLFRTNSDNSYNTNAGLKRYLINTDVNIDVTHNLNVGMQLFGRLQEGNQPGAGAGKVLSDLLGTSNVAYPVHNLNGSWGGTGNLTTNLLSSTLNSGYIQDNSKDVMANVDLRYDLGSLLPGLSIKGKGNLSIQSANAINRSKQDLVYRMNVTQDDTTYARYGSAVTQRNDFISVFNAQYFFGQLALNYDRQFGAHGLSVIALADRRQTIFNYDLPGKATNISGKVTYNYANRYFLEGAINRSGYNRYMPGKQYGTFYAGGIGWDIAQESFIRNNVTWLNQLKLRGAYAHTGNGIDNSGYYIWRQDFSENNGIGGGIYEQGTARSPASGFQENGLANVNISWESARKIDIGIDISMFNNQLQLTGDYYNDRYSDLLQIRGKSIQLSGSAYPPENIGVNRYTGGELTLTYQHQVNNFHYFISANGSIEQSKVLYMDEQRREYDWNKRTGRPVGMPFGYIADGFLQSAEEAAGNATIAGYKPLPGDIKYKDLNNDGVINQFDESPIGTFKPRIYYGANMGISWKGIEISALLQGVTNRKNYVANFATEMGFQFQNFTYGQAYEQITGRWTPETATTATYPRLTADANYNYNKASSTFWMRNGNYFRLKNVNIAYNLPYEWVRRAKLGGVKVFANGLNLFTHAAYDFVDPEVGVGAYPIQRVLNTGVNIKF